MRFRRLVVATSVCLSAALIAAACSSGSDNDNTSEGTTTTVGTSPARKPTVSTPTAAGKGIQALATDMDLASVGYVRQEFFIAGDAVGYQQVGKFGSDGDWQVKESTTAPYKTRIVVIRPKDPNKFSGTVFVEWFNVTGGVDAGPTWIAGHNQILRSGAVWVGVTAQAVGVNGSTDTVQSSAIAIPKGGLVKSDPARYGTLHHPGDLYSYDIFTQAGVAIRGEGEGVKPLPGFTVKNLIAVGESQSSFRLATYVNAVQPLVDEYDGFLVYSRGSGAAPLGDQQLGSTDPTMPDIVRIRSDLSVPVFAFETEYDVDVLEYGDARQPDSANFRLWEMAGGSHQDAYSAGGYALTDLGDGAAEAALLDPKNASGGLLNCVAPINAGGMYAVLESVLAHLETWVRDGTAPPQFGRIETTGKGDNIAIVRDDLGIAKGGLRTPIVDVPLATNIGDAGNSPDFCRVFGHTNSFDAATLSRLYPTGSTGYIKGFDAATDNAVSAGVWLEPEAKNFKAAAEKISF